MYKIINILILIILYISFYQFSTIYKYKLFTFINIKFIFMLIIFVTFIELFFKNKIFINF
jgi:hypothetical protein